MRRLRMAIAAAVACVTVVPALGLLGASAAGAATTPPANSTTVGGLVLSSYCASKGQTVLLKGPIVAPGAAFQWYCVTKSGKQTPINMTAACQYQYPGQHSSAFIADVNNAYSIVCIAPTTGHLIYGPGYVSYTTPFGTITFVYGGGAFQVTFTTPTGASADLVINPDGSGYLAFDGGGGAGGAVLTFDGGGGAGSGI